MNVFNFELLKVPFASGAILSEIEPFPDYVRGLGIAFEQTDGKPEMKGLNGLFNAITASMLSLRQRGVSEWVTDFDYPVGAFSVESGKLYQAKTLNTSKQPSISQSDWTIWASVSDITVHSNGNIKKENSPNGAFELKVEDANTTTKGAARFATATEVANKANVMAAVTPSDIGKTFSDSKNTNGWCRMPNGMIMQWGVVSGRGVAAFPIPFTNTPYVFGINSVTVLGSNDDWDSTSGYAASATNFSYYSETGTANWFAIGY